VQFGRGKAAADCCVADKTPPVCASPSPEKKPYPPFRNGVIAKGAAQTFLLIKK